MKYVQFSFGPGCVLLLERMLLFAAGEMGVERWLSLSSEGWAKAALGG